VLDDFGVGMIPELMPQAHRHAPVGHGAVRVVCGDLVELLFGFFVPEGMQQGDAALKGLLHSRCARSGEGDGAELRGGQVFMMRMVLVVIGKSDGGDENKTGEKHQRRKTFHRNSAEKRV